MTDTGQTKRHIRILAADDEALTLELYCHVFARVNNKVSVMYDNVEMSLRQFLDGAARPIEDRRVK